MDINSSSSRSSVTLSIEHNEQEHITSLSRQTTSRLSVRMRKVLIFILTSFVYFLTWSCTSMWTPFFPGEAGKRGVSSTEVGFIFGTYNLVAFIASLVYGPILIPEIGPYFILFAGLFLNGGANIACSFVNLVTIKQTFSLLCFLVRAIGALGGAACETAIVVILTNEFQDNLTTAIGTLEIFTGLGFIVGPVLGGVMYSLGGFRLPYIVTGGLLLVSLPFIFCLLPRKESMLSSTRSINGGSLFKQAMTIPGVLMMCMACLVLPIATASVEPILEPHAKTFGLDSTGVALLFLSTSAPYIVFSPIAGQILNKKPLSRTFLVVGSLGIAVCTLFFGPAPFLVPAVPEKKTWIIFLSFFLSGFAMAFTYVPLLPEILRCCHEKGLPNSLRTDSLASGLYTGFCNLGSFVGPVIGGILNDQFGFPWTSTIIASIIFSQAVIMLVFFTCSRRRPLASTSTEGGENQPLLSKRSIETYL